MWRKVVPRIRCSAPPFLLGTIALAGLTLVCFRLHSNISTAGFLYLIVIVLFSLRGDFVLSIVTSIIAAVCLAYFFAPPIFSIRVDDPMNVIVIIAFLTTSSVISGLVSQVRRMSEEALLSVNRKLVDAEERERTRIARDLHDDVVQRLALLSAELEQVQQSVPDPVSGLRARIRTAREQTVQIATDLQTISHGLHSSALEYLGLAAAMRGFCREFGKQQKVKIDLRNQDLPTSLSPEISLCLFRVLQEALHNSAKHSGARQFEVELFSTSEAIHLAVHDAGVGFDPKLATRGGGLGLTSMRERMKLVHGKFSIDSQPGKGTTINVCVPLPDSTVRPLNGGKVERAYGTPSR